MATWQDVVDSEPGFADEVATVMNAHKHKLIATLRADGGPRLSGLEFEFKNGEVSFGMMPKSRKAADLRRDPRLEIHSSSPDADETDPSTWRGDARISGRAVELTSPEERAPFLGHDPDATYPLFVVDIERVVRISLKGEPLGLVLETWKPGSPLSSVKVD